MSVVWLTMHDVSVEDVTSGMVNHDLSIDAKINDMECKMLEGKLVLAGDDGVTFKPVNDDLFLSVSESFGSPSSFAKLDTASASNEPNKRPILAENTMLSYVAKPMESIHVVHFSFKDGMYARIKNGLWLIRNVPLILKKWTSYANIKKEDMCTICVWVKFHDIPITAFTKDGLSVIATKLGTLLMLDSYTSIMRMKSWGRSREGYTISTIHVKYEWTPPRCSSYKFFGHVLEEFPKNIADEVFLALGWLLEEIHMTWAHLEKKRTRLWTYTKSFEDLCIQCVETAS
ncbi:copia protein [Tanacetum coccineum]